MNEHEKRVYNVAKDAGWTVLRNGWPDYLLIDWQSKQAIFLEVKSPTDSLRIEQKKMHKALKALGLDVRVFKTSRKKDKTQKAFKRMIGKPKTR